MVNRRTTVLMIALLLSTVVFLVAHRAQADSAPTQLTSVLLAPDSGEVSYQGVLTDDTGELVSDGDYSLTLTLYDAATDGDDLWSETQTVTTTNGLFNVYLGAVTPLDPEIIDGRDLWLGIQVEGDAEMAPRIPIVSVPYARSLVPGAVIRAAVNNGEILTVENTGTFGSTALRVLGRGSDSLAIDARGEIEATGDIDTDDSVRADDNVVAGGNVQAGNNVVADGNIQAGDDLEANRDVLAGRHVEANGNVNANGGNLFGQNVLTNGSVFANVDVDADRDVLAGRHVEANGNVRANGGNVFGQNVQSNGFSTARFDVEADRHVEADQNVVAGNDVIAGGTKSALIRTASFGPRRTYALEGAGVWLVDQGQGQLQKGAATIELDPVFLDTVTIDATRPMLVHVTLTSDSKGVYVAEQTATSFTVLELQGGTSDATFNWQVSAVRRGYEGTRLELYNQPEHAGVMD